MISTISFKHLCYYMLRLLLSALMGIILFHPFSAKAQLARGQTRAGKPVGVWEYFDGSELGLRFDHDSARIKYIRPDTARYLVSIDTSWQAKWLDRAPRILGSRIETLVAIQSKLRYPFKDLQSRVAGTVVLTYVVDKYGKKTNPVAVATPSKALAEEVYRVIESVPLTFLPAIYQGKITPTKVAFVVRFCLCKSADDCQSAAKAQARLVPKPLGFVGEIIVTSY